MWFWVFPEKNTKRTDYSNSNNNSICNASSTLSPMAHSIVSGRCILSWTRMSLADAWMLSTIAWVFSSRSHAQGAAIENARSPIVAPSVGERGFRYWKHATTSVMVCRRPVRVDRRCYLVRDWLVEKSFYFYIRCAHVPPCTLPGKRSCVITSLRQWLSYSDSLF